MGQETRLTKSIKKKQDQLECVLLKVSSFPVRKLKTTFFSIESPSLKGRLKIFKAYCNCHQLRAKTFRAVFPQYFFPTMRNHTESCVVIYCSDTNVN